MPKPIQHRFGDLSQTVQAALTESHPISAVHDQALPALTRPRLITLRPKQITQRSSIQTRPAFDPEQDPDDRQFALSIRKYGVTQPVVVYPLEPGSPQAGYSLVSGHRRLDAALYNHLPALPALLVPHETSPKLRDLLTALENLQRKDLQPLEKARQIERLMQAYGYDQQGVADAIGLSRSQVNYLLQLLDAPGEIQQAVNAGAVGVRNARDVARLPQADRQRVLGMVQGGLPVNAALEQVSAVPPAETPDEPELKLEAPEMASLPDRADEIHKPGRPQRSTQKNATGAADPLERLLGSQAGPFQQILADRTLTDLFPKNHLALLAVIWLANDQNMDAALSGYNRHTRAFKGALDKVFTGFDQLAILRVHAAKPEELEQVSTYIEIARQCWLGE